MGGLDAFLVVVRRQRQPNAWVFAFDETIWHFFERARVARPLFDEAFKLEP